MKILLLAPHPFFQQRGTPIAERMVIEMLARQGHEIEVLTFAEGEDIPGCRILRIPRVPFTRSIQPGFSLKKLANDAVLLVSTLRRARRYDLIHAVEESAFMALAARWMFKVPYVYDMDSGLARQMIDKYPFLRRLRSILEGCESAAVRGSVATLAVCKSLEDHARACNPRGLIARIEDISLLMDADGEADDVPDGPVAMYVGNLQSYQGIGLLLDAFRHTLREMPEAKLVVIGSGPRPADPGENVIFLGPRPVERLGAYLRRATVLVSPRIQGENTPMKIYSYLDSGRPVLATRLPTHTQVLTDDIARLVDPEPAALGKALAELLRDEALRERLARAAKAFAQRELTREAFERKLLRFYDSVEERIREEKPDGQTARLQAR